MRCTSIRIRDIGPFEDETFAFTGHLVGLFGPNGAGKSTVVDMIHAAWTGEFRRFRTLYDALRDLPGGNKVDSGRVEAVFTNGSTTVTIARTLLKNADKASQRVSMKVETVGGHKESISGVLNVAARVAELVGADPALLSRYAFIEQNALSALVNATDAARTQVIHQLFDLERYERLWKLLGEEVSAIPDIRVQDNVAELEAQLAAANDDVSSAAATCNKLTAAIAALQIDDVQETLRLWEASNSQRVELAKAEAACEAARRNVSDAEEALTVLTNELDQLRRGSSAVRARAESARSLLAAADERVRVEVDLQNCDRALNHLIAAAESLLPPVKPTATWTEENESQYSAVSAELQISSSFISAHAVLGDKTVCPSCGQDVRDLVGQLRRHQAVVARLQPEARRLAALRASVDAAINSYQADLRVYASRQSDIEVQLNAASASFTATAEKLAALPSVAAADVKAAKSLIAEADAQAALEADKTRQIASCRSTRLERASGELRASEQACKSLREAVEAVGEKLVGVTTETIQSYRETENSYHKLRESMVRAVEQQNYASQLATMLTTRISSARQEIAAAAAARDVRELLGDARDLFHREALPMVLSKQILSLINPQLERFLDIMQSSFTAWMEQSDGVYQFRCMFGDTSEPLPLDLARGDRFLGTGPTVDMGAYEYLNTNGLGDPEATWEWRNVRGHTATHRFRRAPFL
jgi:chromosome segregation ATPase